MPKQVLQLCHGYEAPFLDVARQYSSLFQGQHSGEEYQVTTVFLIGAENEQVRQTLCHDRVIFLENRSKDLRGLKLKQIKQVKQIVANNRFEFVIAHRYKSIYIALHLKSLFVIGVHHAFDNYLRLSRRWFVSFHQKRLALLGVSNAIRDDIRKALPKYPPERIQTLYNRIDYVALKRRQWERAAAREKLGLEEGKLYWINVGRLHPDKDQKTLIDGFYQLRQQNPDLKDKMYLHLYGKGRLEEALKKQIIALQLQENVILKGHYPDIAAMLPAYDAFVLSSDYEPFGMVLLEAMCAGIGVISTRQGGAGEVLGDKGLLFDVGESEQLAQLMQQWLEMEQSKKASYIKCMQERIHNHFTDDKVRERFFSFDFIP